MTYTILQLQCIGVKSVYASKQWPHGCTYTLRLTSIAAALNCLLLFEVALAACPLYKFSTV